MNKYYLKITGLEWALFIKPKALLFGGKETQDINPLTINEIQIPKGQITNMKLRFSSLSLYPEYVFKIDSSSFQESKINVIEINYTRKFWKKAISCIAYRALPIYAVLYLLIELTKMHSYFKIAIGLLIITATIVNIFIRMSDKTSFSLTINSFEA